MITSSSETFLFLVFFFLSVGGLARVISLDEWRDRAVRGAFDSCLRVSRCNPGLSTDQSRILCSVASWNAFDVEPSRAMVRDVSEVVESRFYGVLGGLEDSGAVECVGRGVASSCRFARCPAPVPAGLPGVRVTRRGRRTYREIPPGSEQLFRHMTGVERQHLLSMVYERAPESWDVAALLDNIDPTLTYSENKGILDALLPPALPTRAELESAEVRYQAYLAEGGW